MKWIGMLNHAYMLPEDFWAPEKFEIVWSKGKNN